MATILVLNGPNLNLLGSREPEVYGHTTLEQIHAALKRHAADAGHEVVAFQSNAEHELIERIHAASREGVAYVLFNPGAYTHTSIALRDAFLGTALPFYEVHLSNVYRRETFRHHSYLSDIAEGVISGFGAHGYELALTAALRRLAPNT
ncbi:MAG: type II 3-dehydroquinate dehydratase [Proteobacteria bacterium]|nr:MAG: type II 3-dehydroquinate dehydratase [Pseudomonadota bacterium]QKK10253.1 MAG: type II 3-dehydroquinate dehydratase [Pseudomonadota bacterium]